MKRSASAAIDRAREFTSRLAERAADRDRDRRVRGGCYGRLTEGRLVIGSGYTERGTKTIFDFKTRLDPNPQGDWRLNGTKFPGAGSTGGDVIHASGKVEGGGTEGTGGDRPGLELATIGVATGTYCVIEDSEQSAAKTIEFLERQSLSSLP